MFINNILNGETAVLEACFHVIVIHKILIIKLCLKESQRKLVKSWRDCLYVSLLGRYPVKTI